MNSCFVATPLGFEKETLREMQEIWPDLLAKDGRPHALPLPEADLTKGGFELAIEPFTAVQLNFFLKTANRILLRLDRFRVRDFPKLHEKLRKIDLKSWIGESSIRFEVSASQSRLNHEGRIQETAQKAWDLPVSDEGIGVYLRIHNDECTVSLDSSGEHLHRRGTQILRGEAPLRETTAAFALRTLIGETAPAELKQITLIDPMCGSGTFLAEAATLWTPNFQRAFAFQKFRRLPKLFQQAGFAKNYKLPERSPFEAYLGFDLSAEMVEISQRNLNGLTEQPIKVAVRDVLSAEKVESPKRTWVVANPPYGERLAGPPPFEILKSIRATWNPEKIGLLLLSKQVNALLEKWNDKPLSRIPVKNGGLDCEWLIFTRPR